MKSIESLFSTLTDLQTNKKLPPVNLWAPSHIGKIDIVINAEGEWFHEGTKIQRQSLVDLFATILRREGDDYFLVTPAEKMAIEVADVPFIAVDMDVRGSDDNTDLLFTTNVADYIMADADHQITMHAGRPYLHVRDNLQARLSRSVYYRLVDLGIERDGDLYIYSQGEGFNLGAVQ
jgi:hypothetical protein